MPCPSRLDTPTPTHLRIVGGSSPRKPAASGHEAWWRINGQRVCVRIWTQEQWWRLDERPDDAQYYACGIWCALRPAD